MVRGLWHPLRHQRRRSL